MTVPTPDGRPVPMPPWIRAQLLLGWLLVGIPLSYGVYETLVKAMRLF
jgi:hypothetical protein